VRAQAIEKVLSNLVDAIQAGHDERIKNYCVKAQILMDRSDNQAASVVREMMNGG
tara:strand:+ start:748 stop:912 length:165 start_codon:yes stop_codon:yes gene_type:complete